MGYLRLSGGSLLLPQDSPRRSDSKIVGLSNGQRRPQYHNILMATMLLPPKDQRKLITRHISYLRVAAMVAIQTLDRANAAKSKNNA